MMKKITLIIVILCCVVSVNAQTFEVGGIKYNITDATNRKVEVTSKTPQYTGAITIPTTVNNGGNTYSVTSIGNDAFYDCSGLTSVSIPNSVTSIGNFAFYNCSSLTSVSIPNSVTSIGQSAFSECSGLTSVSIPNSVTSIEEWAFSECSGLTSVSIPNSVTSIEEWAFSYCSGLTSVSIPNSVTSIGNGAFFRCNSLTSVSIPNSVTSIGRSAFSQCSGLTSVSIPNSVTSIGESAFRYCSGLTSVSIPNSVTSIGDYAFNGCSGLTNISVDAANPNYSTQDGVLFNKAQTTLIQYPIGNTRTTYSIPNSVTSIGNEAFGECSGLTSVTIPNSVKSIGYGAFGDCSSLTSVSIPNSVTSIEGNAFYNCSSLTSVSIPNSVTSIEGNAFYNCSSLTNISVDAANPNYSTQDGVLFNKAQTTLIQYPIGNTRTTYSIPNSVTSIGYGAFGDCSGLTSVSIPSSVTSIGGNAFDGCSGLTSVSIPNSVTSIGNFAFSECSGLTSVSIPSSVTSIGNYAFDGCSGLTSVSIPNSVTSIGDAAFWECSGLTSVSIPNSVTSIGERAFSSCSGLTSVSIPNSVTSIGNYAFYNCSSLSEVVNHVADPSNISLGGSNVFDGSTTPASAKLYVPTAASVTAYSSAAQWSAFGTISPTTINLNVNASSSITCIASGSGAIVIDATGGTPASYQYSKDGVTYQTSNTFSGLDAGTYIIWVKDGTYVNTIQVDIKEQQSITAPATITKAYGDANFTLNATASSSLGVTYTSSNTSVATVSGSTVSIIGAGTATITASQAGNATYCAASKDISLTVNKTNQTITFAQADVNFAAGLKITLNASTDSNLPISYSIVSGDGNISGNELTVNKAGAFEVKATQAGNGNYNAAEAVTVTFNVNKGNQTITFPQLSDIDFKDELKVNLGATASSSLPVTYELVSGDGSISGDELTVNKAGEFTIKAKQAGNENFKAADEKTVTFNVKSAPKALGLGDKVNLKVYPNPATSTVTIKSDKTIDVYFYNLNGKLVLTGKTNTTINVESLEKGIYTVVVNGQSIKLVRR